MVKQTGGALLLTLSIDHDCERPISSQLYGGLRDMILSGGLHAGERLPASRTLGRELGVSRTTVVNAYERLTAEGLIESRIGAGTYVSEVMRQNRPPAMSPAGQNGTSSHPGQPRVSRRIRQASKLFVDRLPHEHRAFTTALPAFDAFPLELWARQASRHWRARLDVMLGYGEPQGHRPLREAIAGHLRINRGISCEPEQVFVVSGAQQAFDLVATVLLDPGDVVWFENPGAIGARNSLIATGAQLMPVPVDDNGLMVDEGLRRASSFRLAFVTPSHQQPLSTMLSLERRFSLLRAAEDADAMIVEDDYDGEFCYEGHPLPTLKSIDASGRVIYVGTFSKTLFPSLRLGYLVSPPSLVDTFDRLISATQQSVPSNLQAVVAEFMQEGHFATHLRRMRRIYAERHQVLLEAGSEHLEGLLDIVPTRSGLHTIGLLAEHLNEETVAEKAAVRGVTVAPIGRFCIEPIDIHGLVLGFSGISPQQIRAGVRTLAEVLEGA